MTKKSPIALAAILLLAGSASLTMLPSQTMAQAKEQTKEQTAEQKAAASKLVVRPEWIKPFGEVQKLIGDKQYAQALEKLNVLAAAEKQTPYEIFFIARNKAALASISENTPLLAASFEVMINSEFLGPEEKLRYLEGMAGTYFNNKQYAESKAWTLRYLERNKDSITMQDLLTRNSYLMNDFVASEKELKAQIEAGDVAGLVPSLDRLRLLHSSYIKLENNDGIVATLERMVKYYPQKDYWGDLLYKLIGKKTFSDRLRLDWYRLLKSTNNLEDDSQYAEMAEITLLAGLPLESKNILDDGYKAGILGVGKNASKHKILMDKAVKQTADDIKTLDASEATAKTSKIGLPMVNMGYNLAVHGYYDRAIELMEQGIAKGGLKAPNEAKLHLGMVYLQSGNAAKASEVFSTIQGNEGAAELAKYWLLYKK
jgi:hypothetical protein